MSTGFECDFFQATEDNKHYYTLQDWDCPVGAWDWTEFSTTYGPFDTLEQAQQHLRDNHANPGGYSVGGFRSLKGLKRDDRLHRR